MLVDVSQAARSRRGVEEANQPVLGRLAKCEQHCLGTLRQCRLLLRVPLAHHYDDATATRVDIAAGFIRCQSRVRQVQCFSPSPECSHDSRHVCIRHLQVDCVGPCAGHGRPGGRAPSLLALRKLQVDGRVRDTSRRVRQRAEPAGLADPSGRHVCKQQRSQHGIFGSRGMVNDASATGFVLCGAGSGRKCHARCDGLCNVSGRLIPFAFQACLRTPCFATPNKRFKTIYLQTLQILIIITVLIYIINSFSKSLALLFRLFTHLFDSCVRLILYLFMRSIHPFLHFCM